MAYRSERIPYKIGEKENLRRYVCFEHDNCLVYEFDLTYQFLVQHNGSDDSDNWLDDSDNWLTVFDRSFKVSYNHNNLKVEFSDDFEPGTVIIKTTEKQNHLTNDGSNYFYVRDEDVLPTMHGVQLHFRTLKASLFLFADAPAKRNADIFHKQMFCDAHFTLSNGEIIGAHIAVLSLGSPVFQAMFEHNTLKTRRKRLKIVDVKPEVFKIFLHFLYSGQLPDTVTMDDCKDLYVVGDQYQVEALQGAAGSILSKRANENLSEVIDLLIFSDSYSADRLRERCLQIMRKKSQEVCRLPAWLEFFKTSPDLAAFAVRYMLDAKDTWD